MLLASILYMIPAKPVFSQGQTLRSKVQVVSPTATPILVQPFDSGTHSAFADFFQRSEFSGLYRYAVVITNDAPQPIKALTLRWTLIDRSGNSRSINQRTDGYFIKPTVVVPERTQAAFWPTGHLWAHISTYGKPLVQIPTEQGLRKLDTAVAVRVTVDTVIFADGSVAGPDESRTIEYLYGREQAAGELVQNVSRAKAENQDISALLKGLAASPGTSGDYVARWKSQLAAQLIRNRGARLDDLARLPKTPIFFRQN
jgi:hypothetical protein